MEQLNFFGCETALRSRMITKQTQRESHAKVNKQKIRSSILDELSYGDMTAREIAVVLYRHKLVAEPTRQQVHPRLTELVQDGLVEVNGTKHDSYTDRNVSLYHKVEVE